MNMDKLLKLADFLETVPPERFDIFNWASEGFSESKCDTAACAAGWACVLFEEEGLRLIGYITLYPSFKEDRYEFALMNFFGLTYNQAQNIFFSSSYISTPGPKDVAQRIRETAAPFKVRSKTT